MGIDLFLFFGKLYIFCFSLYGLGGVDFFIGERWVRDLGAVNKSIKFFVIMIGYSGYMI